jgi:integrase
MNHQDPSASAAAVASVLLPKDRTEPSSTRERGRVTPGAFTKAMIRRMSCPVGRTEMIYWDPSCRGFGLRAFRSGRRSWLYQYRDEHNRTRRMALGDVSAVSLDAAREAARRQAASVAQGANPSLDRKIKRAAGSVLDVVEAYLEHAKVRQRPRTYMETERHLRIHAAPIHHEHAESVTRRQVALLLERAAKVSGPVAANRLRSQLSALWAWGLRTGVIDADSNPVTYTVRQPEKARERTLTDTELGAIWSGTSGADDYCRIVRLCLLTGCRREEIGGLRWDEVRDDRIVIGADRMKGKLPHEIALLPMISAQLPERPENAEGCVFGRMSTGFSGWSKRKRQLDTALHERGMLGAPWCLQDLRRTFSTKLHDDGIQPFVVEALIAHKQQGVAAVYNRASFRDAKRAALMRWHEMLAELCEAPPEDADKTPDLGPATG